MNWRTKRAYTSKSDNSTQVLVAYVSSLLKNAIPTAILLWSGLAHSYSSCFITCLLAESEKTIITTKYIIRIQIVLPVRYFLGHFHPTTKKQPPNHETSLPLTPLAPLGASMALQGCVYIPGFQQWQYSGWMLYQRSHENKLKMPGRNLGLWLLMVAESFYRSFLNWK